MPLEDESNVNGVEDLQPAWPTGTDPKSEGDDHLRVTKKAVTGSFPNMSGPWNTTDEVSAGGFNANSNPVRNVSDPTSNQDAATKAYCDSKGPYIDTGEVGSTGVIGPTFGLGFTCTKEGIGTYRLDFNRSSGNQSFVATVRNITTDGLNAVYDVVDANTIRVRTEAYFDDLGEKGVFGALDASFSFVRMTW